MLIKLILTCFGQHESLTIDFTEGLNVIRGANEAGKSTIYLASLYAKFGARALPLSLEETVTWGHNVNELKVEEHFSIAGVIYKVTRSKSGAELTSSAGNKVSGTSAVTDFIVSILKADLNTVKSVLVVGQGAVGDATKSGTGSLIEGLSNMDLIDKLILGMQEHYVTGNTKALELQLVALKEATAGMPVADFTAEQAEVDLCKQGLDDAKLDHEGFVAALDNVRAAAALAQVKINAHTLAVQTVRQRTLRHADLNRQLQSCVIPEGVDAENLRQKAVVQATNRALYDQHTLYNQIPVYTKVYDSGTEFAQRYAVAFEGSKDIATHVQELRTRRAVEEVKGITEDACAFCGKLLTDVPEVVEVNKHVAERLAFLDAQIEDFMKAGATVQEALERMNHHKEQDTDVRRKAERCTSPYLVRLSGFPATYTWNGPTPEPLESTNWQAKYEQALMKQKQNAQEIARQASLKQQLEDAAKELDIPAEGVLGDLDLEVELGRVAMVVAAEGTVTKANANVQSFMSSLYEAQRKLDAAKQDLANRMQRYTDSLELRASTERTIDAMVDNNTIVKKLREARPLVTKMLWGMVLHLVSDYFSQIRGQISVVTRDEDGFRIDGKPLAAFSGSTQDALGLGIRIALQKVFLPNVDFMLCDESARGMDENRETAMIGALATSGFGQVVVITHSDAADIFATNLIEI